MKDQLTNFTEFEKSNKLLRVHLWGFPKGDLHLLLLVPWVVFDLLHPDEEFLRVTALAELLETQGGPDVLQFLKKKSVRIL